MSNIEQAPRNGLTIFSRGYIACGQGAVMTQNTQRYSLQELTNYRKMILAYARSLPPGAERNQQRQIALSLQSLLKNKTWLAAKTLPGSALQTLIADQMLKKQLFRTPRYSPECGVPMANTP